MNTQFIIRKRANNKGFSLVELIVVIAIMAVLIAIIAPRLIQYIERSRASADESFAGEFARAVQLAMAEETVYGSLQTNLTTVDSSMTITLADAGASATADAGATVWGVMDDFVNRIITTTADNFKSRTHNTDSFLVLITATVSGYSLSVSGIDANGQWSNTANIPIG